MDMHYTTERALHVARRWVFAALLSMVVTVTVCVDSECTYQNPVYGIITKQQLHNAQH